MNEIRLVESSDGQILEELAIRSKQDSPDAFRGTLAEVKSVAPSLAKRYSGADGLDGMGVLAFKGDRPIGFCLASPHSEEANTISVGCMWVDEEERHHDIARDMLRKIKDLSLGRQASHLIAWVRADNSAALSFCKREGFEETGKREPWDSGNEMDALELSLEVVSETV